MLSRVIVNINNIAHIQLITCKVFQTQQPNQRDERLLYLRYSDEQARIPVYIEKNQKKPLNNRFGMQTLRTLLLKK
jgi:hypothetical protein